MVGAGIESSEPSPQQEGIRVNRDRFQSALEDGARGEYVVHS